MFTQWPVPGSAVYDPLFGSVKLLIHANGADGSSSFSDSSSFNRTLTRAGSLIVSTTNPLYTGNLYAASAGDDLSVASNSDILYSGNFTMEFAIFMASLPGVACYFLGDPATASKYFNLTTGGVLTFTAGTTMSFGTLSTGQWYRAVVQQSAVECCTYLNGSRVAVAAAGSITDSGPHAFKLFNGTSLPASNQFIGRLDEIRYTTGARYASGTTIPVPSAPYPDA